MNTASRNAFPNQALHYRVARRHASLNAWKSICRHGTQLVGNTLRGYNRKTARVLLVEGSFRDELRGWIRRIMAVYECTCINMCYNKMARHSMMIDGISMNHYLFTHCLHRQEGTGSHMDSDEMQVFQCRNVYVHTYVRYQNNCKKQQKRQSNHTSQRTQSMPQSKPIFVI